jgi:membrane protein implicated in regulation of membrane protease activity
MNAKFILCGLESLLLGALGLFLLLPAAIVALDPPSMHHMPFGPMVGTFLLFFIASVNLIFLSVRLFRSALKASIEDRLDELERLKRRDMVTPEEYAAKRQEILKDL